jgi:hypothetical protein
VTISELIHRLKYLRDIYGDVDVRHFRVVKEDGQDYGQLEHADISVEIETTPYPPKQNIVTIRSEL